MIIFTVFSHFILLVLHAARGVVTFFLVTFFPCDFFPYDLFPCDFFPVTFFPVTFFPVTFFQDTWRLGASQPLVTTRADLMPGPYFTKR